jgi:hypothetical protein
MLKPNIDNILRSSLDLTGYHTIASLHAINSSYLDNRRRSNTQYRRRSKRRAIGRWGRGQREVEEGAHLDSAPPSAAASPSPPGAPGPALLVLLVLLVWRSSCSWYDAPHAPGPTARVRAPAASPPGPAPPTSGQRGLGSSCWSARSSSEGGWGRGRVEGGGRGGGQMAEGDGGSP